MCIKTSSYYSASKNDFSKSCNFCSFSGPVSQEGTNPQPFSADPESTCFSLSNDMHFAYNFEVTLGKVFANRLHSEYTEIRFLVPGIVIDSTNPIKCIFSESLRPAESKSGTGLASLFELVGDRVLEH